MQHDEIIWSVINHQFCSFKSKIENERTFCRNEYNVTGLCSRSSCPLANSRYATIRESSPGVLHLYVKTIERAHTPKDLWELIPLDRDYAKAMATVEEELLYFPKALKHRCMQRLTKIHQYLIRMRKLELKVKPKLQGIMKKVDRREQKREVKALKAARIEKVVERELVERLKAGTYGDIYNFPENAYNKALGMTEDEDVEGGEREEQEEMEEEMEEEEIDGYVEDEDYEEDDLEDYWGGEGGSDDDEEEDDEDDDEDSDEDDDEGDSDEESSTQPKSKRSKLGGNDDDDDDDDEEAAKPPSKKGGKGKDDAAKGKKGGAKKDVKPPKKKGGRVEIEYENEEENDSEMARW